MGNEMVVEKGERCKCGGEIDSRVLIQSNPDIYSGRCFQCDEPCTVLDSQRYYDNGEA